MELNRRGNNWTLNIDMPPSVGAPPLDTQLPNQRGIGPQFYYSLHKGKSYSGAELQPPPTQTSGVTISSTIMIRLFVGCCVVVVQISWFHLSWLGNSLLPSSLSLISSSCHLVQSSSTIALILKPFSLQMMVEYVVFRITVGIKNEFVMLAGEKGCLLHVVHTHRILGFLGGYVDTLFNLYLSMLPDKFSAILYLLQAPGLASYFPKS